MDPASAIGVASAVISFVDFGIKIIRGAIQIYGDANRDNDWQTPEDVAKKMTNLARNLRQPSGFGATPDEGEIAELAKTCMTLAERLAALFKSLQPKDARSKRQCLWAAAKAKLKQADVEDLEKKLGTCRDQLQLHLIQSGFLNGKNMKDTLEAMILQQKADSAKLSSLFTSIESLKEAVTLATKPDEVPVLEAQALAHLREAVSVQSGLLDDAATSTILKSIAFYRMNARYESIHDAHQDTFRWILEDDDQRQLQPSLMSSKQRLNDWLCNGTGIFHISGKLGSGKSTLMKLLVDHPHTQQSLQTWAGSSKILTPSFFFWRPGTKEQKSIPGLYCSLLHSSLKAMPDLIPHVLPGRWQTARSSPWHINQSFEISDKEIRSAFALLVDTDIQQWKYSCCFFIDGLDEYEESPREDHRDLVDLITKWAKSSRNVKLCVSSREYNIYMDAFLDSHRIKIHTLTQFDIEAYATERLSQISWWPGFDKLIHNISQKAKGIFLWVTLVIREMRYQLDNHAAPEDLETQLDCLPRELEDLYSFILNNLLRTDERRRAFQTFRIMNLLRQHNQSLLLWEHTFSRTSKSSSTGLMRTTSSSWEAHTTSHEKKVTTTQQQ
ncbi:hypothetical protein HYQ46_001760 [Verticillium longisporum]|nr:hypothetical protein HYQ44_020101 [Verticillium longisporum]KAG7149330.1 hypothetical protein HYQ46_001760 [Verticillium longisporum]